MFLSDVSKLSRGSHAKVSIECSVKQSEKCKGIITTEYRSIMNTIERNNGTIMCLQCSRHIKHGGNLNPNCRYNFDRNLLDIIDTPEKAYLLGWIASDGSVCKNSWSVRISILEKDIKCLEILRNIICENLPIKKNLRETTRDDGSILIQNFVSLTINSKEMCKSICKHLSISRGKKSNSVKFPNLDNDDLTWVFIRGYFEGDGTIRDPLNKHNLDCKITSDSINMLKGIGEFSKIPYTLLKDSIEYSSSNCLDFMGKLYNNKGNLFLERKYERYVKWLLWKPALFGKKCKSKLPDCLVLKTDKDAIIPSKTNNSDAGYDISIIKKVKDLNENTSLYDSGIKIKVNSGLYAELVPRSSLSKSGYILSNSIGILDPSYFGNIYVALTKINSSSEDIKFPFRCCQLIFREQIHVNIEEVTELIDSSSRGDGGFGSTGN